MVMHSCSATFVTGSPGAAEYKCNSRVPETFRAVLEGATERSRRVGTRNSAGAQHFQPATDGYTRAPVHHSIPLASDSGLI